MFADAIKAAHKRSESSPPFDQIGTDYGLLVATCLIEMPTS
jgi:hypothetical protein